MCHRIVLGLRTVAAGMSPGVLPMAGETAAWVCAGEKPNTAAPIADDGRLSVGPCEPGERGDPPGTVIGAPVRGGNHGRYVFCGWRATGESWGVFSNPQAGTVQGRPQPWDCTRRHRDLRK